MNNNSNNKVISKVSSFGGDLEEAAIDLLKKLIATPSFSREEDKTSEVLENFFKEKNISVKK